jgi:pilus assembly protein FimV
MDLARAYISMGDKEAARVILEEVLAHGNDEQQTEARKMLDLMAS